jgi:hypothetical protein
VEKYTSQFWEIALADGWEAERSKHCVTICHPDGVGALQVSGYQKPKGEVTRGDLLGAADLEPDIQKHLGEQKWGVFEGFQLVYSANNTFWRKWWLGAGKILIFVTYNCELDKQEVELSAVNSMVSSLRKSGDEGAKA